VNRFWQLCSADFFSPKDLFRHGVLIVVVFTAAHLCGLREYASVLSGTTGGMHVSADTAAVLGLLYILRYFAAVLGAPILLLAAAISALGGKWFSSHRE